MDVFDLVASLELDSSKYDSGLSKALGTAQSMGGKIAKGISVVGAAAGAALGAAAVGVTAISKQAVSAYANYEQLVGGVETLFGNAGESQEEYVKRMSAQLKELGRSVDTETLKKQWQSFAEVEDKVLKNASNAYKSAGLSANEYMSTVTSFTAALKQNIDDTGVVADVADMAVRDMSDNASKMGTSMEAIQNAYNGFSKQNYNMLDNLKLGYGGTKSEMERLLADAEKMPEAMGRKFDLNNYADVIEAIHVVQENMRITGTTAKEAMFTIEGSAAATKSAWENVLTAIGGGGDLGEAFSGLETALFGGKDGGGFLNNIIPRIQETLNGISSFIEKAAPEIANKLPSLIDRVLPGVTDAAVSLVGGFTDTLSGLLSSGSVIESLTSAATETFTKLVSSLSSALPTIINTISNQLPTIIEGVETAINTVVNSLGGENGLISSIASLVSDNAPVLLDAVLGVVENLVRNADDIITPIISKIPTLINDIVNVLTEGSTINSIIDGVISLGEQVANMLPDILPQLMDGLSKLLVAVAEGLSELMQSERTLIPTIIESFVTALIESAPALISAILQVFAILTPTLVETTIMMWPLIIGGLIEAITNTDWIAVFSGLINGVTDAMNSTIDAIAPILNAFIDIWDNVSTWWNGVKEKTSSSVSAVVNNIVKFITSIPSVVSEKIDEIGNAINSFMEELPYKIGEFLGTVFQNVVDFGKQLYEFVVEDVPNTLLTVYTFVSELPTKIWGFLVDTFNRAVQFGTDLYNYLIVKVPEILSKVYEFFAELPGKVKDEFTKAYDNAVQWLKDMYNKVKEEVPRVVNKIKDGFSKLPSQIKEVGKNLVHGLWDGINGATSWLKEKIGGFASGVIDGFKQSFDIHSPSGKARDLVGKFIALGVGEGIEENIPLKSVDKMYDSLISESKGYNFDDITSPVGAFTPQYAFAGAGIETAPVINLTAPIYLGNELLDTAVLKAINRANYRSGGR